MVNLQVTKLRSRIFTCCKNKNFRKAKKLQRLMLKSNSNLLQSIRRVTLINTGRKTPGIDDEVRLTPEERIKIFYELKEEGLYSWQPKPVKRIYIPKPDGRKRPLGIPTVKDRIWQNVDALEPEWEQKFESSSYGFRPMRSYNDALNRIYVSLSKRTRLWIVDADISGCFDNSGHTHLLDKFDHFPAVKIVEKWLKAGILNDGIWSESNGTLQSGIISPLLCNISLHRMEKEIGVKISPKGYVTGPRLLVRYADDLVILCNRYKESQNALKDLKKSLAKRKLEISEEKTKITHIIDGFDFLGFNIKLKAKDGIDYKKIFVKENTINGVNLYKEFDKSKTILLIEPSLQKNQ